MSRIPRPLKLLGLAAGAWIGLFVVFNELILVSGVAARLAGKDPQLHDDSWPPITHLRMVDDKLLVGGQTTMEEYSGLTEHGVTMVIDARTGSRTDRGDDDPEQLAAIGLDYATLSIPDGRAPTPAQVRRFLDLVDSAEGRVFAHCGGGVGRSTSLAAAYEASLDQNPSMAEQLAVGPPTLEQIWYVATMPAGEPEHRVPRPVAIFSRLVDSPRTVYGWVTSLF